jgi:short-subunit dehydrogenase
MASVTLITGASSGLGAEFARLCAARGDEVVLLARRRRHLEQLAATIGRGAQVLAIDLHAPDGPQSAARTLRELDLKPDTLINNAGFGLVGKFHQQALDRQREMLRLNVEALTMLTRLLLPDMVERGRGAILNVASTAAFQPGPGMAVYFASKAYVLSFSEALHEELRGAGIKVSALCPGPTATEFGEVAGARSNRFERFAASAADVAAAGLAGLARNQAVVIPGLVNKATAPLMRRMVAAIKI